MPSNLGGLFQLIGRLGAASLALYLGIHYMHLPLAASVGIAQIVFYVSFVIVPVHLTKLLLLTELEATYNVHGKTAIVLPCNPGSSNAGQISIDVTELMKNPEVELVSRITQLQKLIRSRDRQFTDLFFHDMIPVLMVVAGTVVFAIAIQKLPAQELQHLGINPQASVISFAQGLIGVVPVVWALGKLYGEITFIRQKVFELLD